MPLTFTVDSTYPGSATASAAVTMNINISKETMESNAQIQPIPGQGHLIIRLGSTGESIQFTGRVWNQTDHDMIKSTNGETVLDVSGSTYPEFPNGTQWLIMKRDTSRKGGYLNMWDVQMTLMKVYSGGIT